MARKVDFSDGFQTATTPTIGNLVASDLVDYANDAAYEAAESGAPAEGNIYYNTTDDVIRYYANGAWHTLIDADQTQTITNKTIDGTDATGTNTITNDATDVSYDNTTSSMVATDAQSAIDEVEGRVDANETDIANLETLSGVSGASNLGTFPGGTTISDNTDIKTALSEVEIAVESKINSSEKGSANGVATLDGSGKIPSSQLTVEAMEYLGSYDASGGGSGSPSLTDGTGDTGDLYRVSVAGTVDHGAGSVSYDVGDSVVYSGTVWQKFQTSTALAGANTTLSNLDSPTSINQNLLPSGSETLGASTDTWSSAYVDDLIGHDGSNEQIRVSIGSDTDGQGNSVTAKLEGRGNATTYANPILIGTDGTGNADDTRGINIITGAQTGSGDSGDIVVGPGTVNSGTRGKLRLKDGSEGTSGQVWTSNDTDGGGSWAAPGALQVRSDSTGFTAAISDDVLLNDTSGGGYTVVLPTASGNTGKQFKIKKTDSSFNALTIDGNASETIDGSTTTTLDTEGETLLIVSDGTNWEILERKIPSAPTAYTPTFTALGTATNVNFTWQRIGGVIRIDGKFTTGTTSASEGRISLPTGLSVPSSIPTISIAGLLTRSSATSNVFYALKEASNAYITYSVGSGGGSFSKLNGDNIGSSLDVSVIADIPIDGWNG